jgi:O-methyltransferase
MRNAELKPSMTDNLCKSERLSIEWVCGVIDPNGDDYGRYVGNTMTSRVYSHSGDISELLAALPIIKQLGGGDLVLFSAVYSGNRMSEARFNYLHPFLELQPYLSAVRYADRPEGLNLDRWREQYRHHLNLTDNVAKAVGQPHPDRDQPWLKIDKPNRVAPILFARSHLHRNAKVDWHAIYNEYGREAVFVGTPEEHHDFQRAIGPISYHYTPSFLQLARVVAGADFVCVNQSPIRWLTEGFKLPVLVEVDGSENNSHWKRVGAYYLYGKSEIPKLKEIGEIAVRCVTQRSQGRTLIGEERLGNIARLVRGVRQLPGDLAEVGSYKGGSGAVIASSCLEKRLRLFDTWEGIPEDDALTSGHRKGDFAANFDDVKNYLQLYNVECFKGVFPRTAPTDSARYAFVHLDGDTYQSTKAGLEYFLPRIVEGGILVLDDWDWKKCPGVRKAVEEMTPHLMRPDVQVTAPLQAWYRK